MTQEDKELLLKDICARWPYNNLIVRVTDINDPSYQEEGKLRDIKYMDIDCNGIPFLFNVENVSVLCDITEIKPYLRPMSSMTEEEEKEFDKVVYDSIDIDNISPCVCVVNWLYSKCFDVYGLIPKSLALPAHVEMY